MIYKKSVLLICCCKLCCVYCAPKLRLVQNFNGQVQVPPLSGDNTITDRRCQRQDCKEELCGSSKNGISLGLSTEERILVDLRSLCDNPQCNTGNCYITTSEDCGNCVKACDVACNKDCSESDKPGLLIVNTNKKCCTHKHDHSKHTHGPGCGWDFLVHLPKCLHSSQDMFYTINQPIPKS